ncbi:hypothetical protein P280DRAFT_168928 [Massarina eburnea CBS 473.64]|uniref:Uncharacterized protein n=1 Tax=Massarina eburnea CBS 473.64 TaxID=1395130 RepID=A0A6A6RK55_9PLEO|nr:hypothetical protein P280DRAFT_168928 [Massarina eburnea CBS 473.64]
MTFHPSRLPRRPSASPKYIPLVCSIPIGPRKSPVQSPVPSTVPSTVPSPAPSPVQSPVQSPWHKLPDELKLEILETALVLDGCIGHKRFTADILPYFLVCKDFARLAPQAFYARNTLWVKGIDVGSDAKNKAIAPPPRNWQWVTKIDLFVGLTVCIAPPSNLQSMSDWGTIVELAKGQKLFTALKHVRLRVVLNTWLPSTGDLPMFRHVLKMMGVRLDVDNVQMFVISHQDGLIVPRERLMKCGLLRPEIATPWAGAVEKTLREEFGCQKIPWGKGKNRIWANGGTSYR